MMKIFKPTFLYVKTHNITGLKYFGKTVQKDPYKYKGSGTHWKYHINKHGNDVTTEIIGLFDDKNWCYLYAVEFSQIHDIVKSENWANLKEESLDGGWDHLTQEQKQKAKETNKNKSPEEKIIINLKKARHGDENGMFGADRSGVNAPMLGKFHTEITKQKQSNSRIGKVNVIDKNGVIFQTSVDDPRRLTGELLSINLGMCVVRDITGNTFQVAVNDPRLISGELIHINEGIKRTGKEKEAISLRISKLFWFNNGIENRRVDYKLESPWVRGKLQMKPKLPKIKTFNNGVENKRMRYPLDDSWVEGKIKIKRIWINNGISEKSINEKKLFMFPDWNIGRTPSN